MNCSKLLTNILVKTSLFRNKPVKIMLEYNNPKNIQEFGPFGYMPIIPVIRKKIKVSSYNDVSYIINKFTNGHCIECGNINNCKNKL